MQFSPTRNLLLALPIIFGASCSSVNKIALRSTSEILEKGSQSVNREGNWHFFKASAPANIMMLEGMSFADPENARLLGMSAKAYGGYAFGVRETLYLEDLLGDSSAEFNKKQAISAYSKGFEYGLLYLEQKGIGREEVFSKDAAHSLPKRFDEVLEQEDMSAVFYTGQSLGGLINLQKDDVGMLSRIGAAKAMMDWVCERDMSFENGACLLFYALYEASRPAMLGGDLEKGKRIFQSFIKKYPQNLLGRVSYIQFYVIPMMDELEYAKEREVLIREFAKWEESLRQHANAEGNKYKDNPQYNLFNAIAFERFKIIEKHKENIF